MAGTAQTNTSSNFKQNAELAAIIALASGIVGLITALITLYVQAEPVVIAAIKRDFAPIGTVIASVLDPPTFAESIGEREGDAYTKRKWILADGRDVIDTAYARLTKGGPVPNLQGMFLRGIDLKNRREPGSVQNFSTAIPTNNLTGITSPNGSHSHSGGVGFSRSDRYSVPGGPYAAVGATETGTVPSHTHDVTITGGGDAETRPVNVAVFYYIKIN